MMEYVYIYIYIHLCILYRVHIFYRYESVQSVDIEDIVWEVTSILEKTYGLFVAYNPVGLESRLQDAIKLLKNKQPEHDLVTVDRNNRIRMHGLVRDSNLIIMYGGFCF